MTYLPNASVTRHATVIAAAIACSSCQRPDAQADVVPRDDETIGSGTESDVPRGRIPYGFNGVPYLAQWAAPWGRLRYGDDPRCSTFADGGCAPTALAMVLRTLGHRVDPDDIGMIAVSHGVRRCPGGTDGMHAEFLRDLADRFGVDATVIHRDDARVLALLRERQPVIAAGRCSGYTARGRSKSYGAHYLVLTGIDQIRHRGKRRTVIRVNDPGNPSGVGISYMTLPQLRRLRRFLHLAPDQPDRPAIAFASGAMPSKPTRCDQSVLRSWRRFVRSGTLSDGAWLSYGRSLAACDPRHRPWEALGAGDREQFLDDYVIPFVNGDAVRGSPFQRSEPNRYDELVRRWRLEG